MKKEFKIDQEIVEIIRKSKEIVGPLLPCVRDQDGNLLAGKHRKVADENWPEIVKHVKDELEREVLKLHYNIQRRVPLEETEASLLRIAELLVKKGIKPKNVCARVKKLVPFTPQYVELLLPPKYKRDYEKSQIFGNLHKGVKKKFDRVKESKRLAKYLTKLEEQGKIKPSEKDEFVEVIEEMANPSLPFPDCMCQKCPHYKECYGV